MKLQRLAFAVAGFGLLAATTTAATATATSGSALAAAESCHQMVLWPTTSKVVDELDVYAHKPPAVTPAYKLSNFFATRFMDTWYTATNASGSQYYAFGLFLQGPNLYRHTTIFGDAGTTRTRAVKIGTGWASFKSITTSNFSLTGPRPAYLYGLNTNGSLYRYAPNGAGYKAAGSFAGFKSFKTMTMISEERTYDTLLMTTKAGALYTIHIPITAKAKPVVKLIRKSGWAAYESLVAWRCGVNGGTLVTGVDHDTNTGYQYAFSKFNGARTAMTSYGKVPAVFNGINHVALTAYGWSLLGE